MRIIIASPEAVPYIKTGGLADVTGALLEEFRQRGENASLILPLYAGIRDRFDLHNTGRSFMLSLGDYRLPGVIWASDSSPHPSAYFIECDELFDRPELYGTTHGDYHDNSLRFAYFSRAVLETCQTLDIRPDVIHCNDWQTGLVPLYLREIYRTHRLFRRTATVITVHNLGYQGLFNKFDIRYTGLGWEQFTLDKLEFHDMLNYLKAGLVYADLINTVSVTYAREILMPENGFGLDSLLRSRKKDFYGIVNGIDYHEFDPAHDALLPARYDLHNPDGRKSCRNLLLQQTGLSDQDLPVIGIVTRFASQKGLDLIAEAMDALVAMGLNIVMLGKGEDHYHRLLTGYAERYKGRVSLTIGFSEELSRLIYSGSDFFLMPSRYEPCGLGQLIALRYGAIPIARRTGGLADTIRDYDPRSWQGTGFMFSEYTVPAMLAAVRRALAVYHQKERLRELIREAMSVDVSWQRSADLYIMLYRKAIVKAAG